MFRFQRMLSMQAQACQKLSRAILLREPYQHDAHFERAFMHLDAALDRVQASGAPAEQMKALGFLLNNLRAIDAQLATIESAQTSAPANSATETCSQTTDLTVSAIFGCGRATCRQNRLCSVMRSGCHWSSVPAMRLSSSPANHGYWILLTSLFVCQPNYNATRHRLALRDYRYPDRGGMGLPILLLVPSVEGQLLLIVLTGVLFFAFRNVQYAHATCSSPCWFCCALTC